MNAKSLFDRIPHTVAAMPLNPRSIHVRQVNSSDMLEMQRCMSKAVWRPAPGRKLAFFVQHDDVLIGLIFLASPVINLGVRDKYLNLPKEPTERGRALRSIMDLSVCVGSQPLAWHWNIGKLCAMLATTLVDEFTSRYGDPLLWVTTTSLYGRGCQYNRIYKFLGYTKGYGHEHIDDWEYSRMLSWMRDNKIPIPSCRFGEGSNPRMRRIAAYRKASQNREIHLKHGHQRGVYIHAALSTSKRAEIINAWYERWGYPRWTRTQYMCPPYNHGLHEDVNILERGT